jgi:hypothetical protein
MDLAKMAAILEIVAPLEDENFRVWKQTRTGLLSHPLETNAARAHLSASNYLQMALCPNIIHIVGHTEAHHAATAQDIIDAALMARRAIENALAGQPDMLSDPDLISRRDQLIAEARVTLQAITHLHKDKPGDAFNDPATLAEAVKQGILDAPHLRNNPYAPGTIRTRILNGACEAVDDHGNWLPEAVRLSAFL